VGNWYTDALHCDGEEYGRTVGKKYGAVEGSHQETGCGEYKVFALKFL
jgi:hypothetical protein